MIRLLALSALALVGAAHPAAHQRLVYANDGKIVVFDTATGRSRVVSRLGRAQVEGGAEPHWSPGGKRLSLIGRDGALLSMNADGTGVRLLVDGDNHAEAWSSDGRWAAFQAFVVKDSRDELRIVRSDGTRMHRISTDSSLHPLWIPGTHRMVSRRGAEIVVVGAGARLRVLPHSTDAQDPALSRDGRWIAFARGGRIYVERMDGSGLRAVTRPNAKHFDTEPAWAPDGRRLSFSRSTSAFEPTLDAGPTRVMVVGADGRGAREVPQTGSNDASAWSADGRFLSYTHDAGDPGRQVVVVDLRANRTRTVGFFDGNDARPDWVRD